MNYVHAIQRVVGWILLVVFSFAAADLTAAALDRRLQVPVKPMEQVAHPAAPQAAPGGDLRAALQTNATVQPSPTPELSGADPEDEEAQAPAANALKLKGTVAGGGWGLAMIESAGETRAVGLGEEIDGYRLVDVGSFSAELEKEGQSRTLTMEFDSAAGAEPPRPMPPQPAPVVPAAPATPAPEPGPAGKLSMEELRGLLDNPESYAGKFRMTPVQREGDSYGMLLQFTAGDNPLARLGLRHGDIVISLNGKPLRGPDDLQLAYRTLRNSPNLTFQVERGNQLMPVTVTLE